MIAPSEIHMHIRPKWFNRVYVPFLFCVIPLQIFYGGASSGKSTFLASRLALDLIKGSRNYLVIRNTANTLHDSVWMEVVRAMTRLKIIQFFQLNVSRNEITCLLNGHVAVFRGLDDPEKLKSIIVPKGVITDLWIEEATEASEEAYAQLVLRMRGRSEVPKRVTLSFNPINSLHWIKRQLMPAMADSDTLIQTERLLALRTTHHDNRFLDAEDRERIESLRHTNPYRYRVYGLGQWGVLGKLIYENWSTADLSQRTWPMIRNGLDFGFADDPAAFVRGCYERKHHRAFIFAGAQYPHLSNQQLAAKLLPAVGGELIRCDSAEPKSISELRTEGVNARATKKRRYTQQLNPSKSSSVLYAIQWTQGLSEIVIDKSLGWLINEFQIYQWRKDRATGLAIPEPVDANDHGIQAWWYSLDDEMAPKTNTVRVTSLADITDTEDEGEREFARAVLGEAGVEVAA